jgi:hypothetical protein
VSPCHWTNIIGTKSEASSCFSLAHSLDEYEDSRLFEVLQHVGLYAPMKKVSSEITLSSLRSQDSEKRAGGRAQPIKSLTGEVSEGGTNFSVGE